SNSTLRDQLASELTEKLTLREQAASFLLEKSTKRASHGAYLTCSERDTATCSSSKEQKQEQPLHRLLFYSCSEVKLLKYVHHKTGWMKYL
ncbi:hypothetical protein AMECASPLE_032771, partial [Ameca splendens]